MAVKVRKVSRKVECECGVELSYTKKDVKETEEQVEYGDMGFTEAVTFYWVKCPECKEDIRVSKW